MEASAVRSAVLADRNFSLTCGSKGPLWSLARTIERSQESIKRGLGGFNLLAPIRNLTMRSCFSRDWPSTASWWATIAAKYTFKVEGDSLRSNLSCRKKALLQSCAFGVFSARRTPVREQTPLQCIGLPCWRSSSLSDGLYYSMWLTTQVCCVPSRSHTWRFLRSGRGCHMVPSHWERRSFLRGMGVGQYGATSRTFS